MKQSKTLNIILFISGLIVVIVGSGILFFPAAMHATAGIHLDGSTNLMNEMRAAGGPLLVGGIVIILGAFYERLRFTAMLMASILYLSYGFARIFSIAIDGVPSSELIQITAFEIVIGLICIGALFFYSRSEVR